jgi:hypothetical protein
LIEDLFDACKNNNCMYGCECECHWSKIYIFWLLICFIDSSQLSNWCADCKCCHNYIRNNIVSFWNVLSSLVIRRLRVGSSCKLVYIADIFSIHSRANADAENIQLQLHTAELPRYFRK